MLRRNKEDIEFQGESSGSLLKPQRRENELNCIPLSVHAKLQDPTASFSTGNSHKMVSLIRRFEELESMTAPIRVTQNRAGALWPGPQLSLKRCNEKAGRFNPQLKISCQTEGLQEAEIKSNRIGNTIKLLNMAEMPCKDHSDDKIETSLPLSSRKLESCEFSAKPMEDQKNLSEELPTLNNCIASKRKVSSMQDKIRFFEGKITLPICFISSPTN